MKKRGCSTFAVLTAIWFLFWPLIAHVSMQSHRRLTHLKIKHSVESVLTEHFTVPLALIPNLTDLKEFDYNGNRYDLISAVKSDGVWQVSAVNDKKEKALERSLKRQSQDDSNQNLSFWLNISIIGNCIETNKMVSSVFNYPELLSFLSSGHRRNHFPPPDQMV